MGNRLKDRIFKAKSSRLNLSRIMYNLNAPNDLNEINQTDEIDEINQITYDSSPIIFLL